MFLNGGMRHPFFFLRPDHRAGEFYGHNFSTTNLEMIARFFEKYPEYADKTFLSIKVRVKCRRDPMYP